MTGYTKLFGSIIASTIWREAKDTKIVWITMLAMANRDGRVEASVPGLADMARVTLKECEEALKVLSSPDAYSRSKENEGRRIEEIDGGWQILNHKKYREKMGADERREYLRLKQQEHRAKKASSVNTESTNVTHSSTRSTHAEAEAEAKAEKTTTPPTASAAVAPSSCVPSPVPGPGDEEKSVYSQTFEDFWTAYPRKVGKKEAWKAWGAVKAQKQAENVLAGLERAKRTRQWTRDNGQFIPHPSTWLRREGWNDEEAPLSGGICADSAGATGGW